jgi:polysaccharide biosynthesis protein PslH
MKILWIKAGGLVPADTGGKIRSYNILRELARHHSVTFFSFYGAHDNDVHDTLENVFDRVVCVPLALPRAKSYSEMREYAMRAFSLTPYNIAKYCRPQVRNALRALLREESYDVILCDFLFSAGVIPWDWPCAKVVFMHNVETMIWKRHYEVARHPLWKLVSWREWQTMKRAERRYLQKADHVLAVSEADKMEFLDFLDPAKLSIVPTAVDSEYFRPSPELETTASIVFTGSMDWLPNEDGIFYFVKEILPLVRERVPDVSVSIVGRNPTRRLLALADRESGIEITGWVEDVRPFVAKAAVSIVPLRIAGGTRIKIYEAMAMAKPVVSTSVGAEGLPVTHGQNILLADNPADFAEAVVSLLLDAAWRKQLGCAARTFVSETYSWPIVTEALTSALSTAVSRSS